MSTTGWILDSSGAFYDVGATRAGELHVTDQLYKLLVTEGYPLLFFYSRMIEDRKDLSDVPLESPDIVFARGPDALRLHRAVAMALTGGKEEGPAYPTERKSAARGFGVVRTDPYDPDSETSRTFRSKQEKLAWNYFLRTSVAVSPLSRVALFSQTLEGEVLEAVAVTDEGELGVTHGAFFAWEKSRKAGLASGRKGRHGRRS